MATRTRQWIVAAAVVATISGCSAVSAHAAGNPQPPTPAHSSTAGPSPSATVPPTVPASPHPSSRTPAPVRVAACMPAMLDPRPYYRSEGAMGSAYQDVIVQNRGHAACRLDSPARLLYTDAHGSRHTLPTTRMGNGPAVPAIVPAGGWATFDLRTVNGRPAGGACGSEVDYPGLSMVLAGQRYPLHGLEIDVTCPRVEPPGIGIGDWQVGPPDLGDGLTTRAPAA